MSKSEVVEVVYGKHHKYEIVKSSGTFSSPTYSIHRDGKYYRGSFDSLAKAVEAARQEG